MSRWRSQALDIRAAYHGVSKDFRIMANAHNWPPNSQLLERNAASWQHPGMRGYQVCGSGGRQAFSQMVQRNYHGSFCKSGSPSFARHLAEHVLLKKEQKKGIQIPLVIYLQYSPFHSPYYPNPYCSWLLKSPYSRLMGAGDTPLKYSAHLYSSVSLIR